MKLRPRESAAALAAIASLGSTGADAVHLGTNGLGQALIYPYYTVRESQGANAFNTYLTVVNTTGDAKAVRVRLREGRIGKAVLDFNLYLSPNDVWAAAVVPTATGAQLLAADTTCTDPAFIATGSGSTTALPLNANAYTGSNADGFGDSLDRTREGYVEMIEMATLSGSSAAAVTHNVAGVPANCPAIRATLGPLVGAPSGGLWGTLTLINVNNGQDFTLDATPLAGLATRAFFRPPGDPYPDFNANEVDPVSTVIANGQLYRSAWSRPVDAVSAVLMRSAWLNEYVMDEATASFTDVVVNLPTRHHYADAAGASPPFTGALAWNPGCSTTVAPARSIGEPISISFFNREEATNLAQPAFPVQPPAALDPALCAAVGVASVRVGASHVPPDTTRNLVFGSATQALGRGGSLFFDPYRNGWMAISPVPTAAGERPPLVSLPASTRTNLATGEVTTGAHAYLGLPVIGFIARTFTNGTLVCGAGACQGNYGGAFPFKFRRSISPR